jgi:hypothetical protein
MIFCTPGTQAETGFEESPPMNEEPSPIEQKTMPSIQRPEQTKAVASPEKLPIGIRLSRGFLVSLALILVVAILLAVTLVFVDLGQRKRIAREQAALSDGGAYLNVNGTLVHFRKSGPVPDPLALVKPSPRLS